MCGIFGIFGHPEAANITYLGLHSLQHRGQESAGIAAHDGHRMYVEKAKGLVGEGFTPASLEQLKGDRAIGHVRYSTAGGSDPRNSQPIAIDYRHGELAVAHNGNLLHSLAWRDALEQQGAIFQTKADTEIILHLMSRSAGQNLVDRVVDAVSRVQGAYSLLALGESGMVAVRDPWGFRPLVMGRLGDSTVFASETAAFGIIGAEFIREVRPGEVIFVSEFGMKSMFPFSTPERTAKCVFEQVYFARPDSTIFGRSVYDARVQMGRILAKEHPVDADCVVPVPDSGIAAAIGFAQESGIPFCMGLIRSHYVGRTFIEPKQSIRAFGVRLKLSPVQSVIKGRRLVVIDDSLVRGTTSRKLMSMLREADAREIHLRISSPPVTHSCFFGIDIPTREELIAYHHSVEEIREYLLCDSLGYLSREGMLRAIGARDGEFCTACFDGDYAIDPFSRPELILPGNE